MCNSLIPSQSNGKPRSDNISFIGLQPIDVLCVDKFAFNGNKFLAIKDYLSSYCWMVRMAGTDTNHVLRKLNLLQAAFRRIKKLVTDNGPNLSSAAMASWCAERRIDHEFSAPYHPEGNSIAELGMKQAKADLCRAQLSKLSADDLLCQSQTLWMGDSDVSP